MGQSRCLTSRRWCPHHIQMHSGEPLDCVDNSNCTFPHFLVDGVDDNLHEIGAQSIQNAAARLLTGTRRRDHISPVLSRLHWLPVKQRVIFKLATIVFKSLRSETPSYLANLCQLVADSGRAIFVRQMPTPSLSREVTLGSETGVFRWRVRKSGTVFLPH